jgi:hypothetical protein
MKPTKRTQRAPKVNQDWQHALRFARELERRADDLLKDPQASGTSRAFATLFRDGALNVRKAVILYVGLTRLQSRSESQMKTIMAALMAERNREDFGTPRYECIAKILSDESLDPEGKSIQDAGAVRKRVDRFRSHLRPGTPTRVFLDAIWSSMTNDFYQERFAPPQARKSNMGHHGRKFEVA